MKINKNSWHYKLAGSFGQYSVPTNLCPYVRQVFIGICLSSLIIMFFLCCVALLIIMLSVPLLMFKANTFIQYLVFLFISICSYTSLGVVLIDLIRKYENKLPEYLTKEIMTFKRKPLTSEQIKELELKREKSFLRVIEAYIEALHNKVCPQINFVEDDNEQ